MLIVLFEAVFPEWHNYFWMLWKSESSVNNVMCSINLCSFRVLFRPSGERSESETATARIIEEDYNTLGPMRWPLKLYHLVSSFFVWISVLIRKFMHSFVWECLCIARHPILTACFSPQEVVTAFIFILMVVLWVFRDPGFMPGWASIFLPEWVRYPLLL